MKKITYLIYSIAILLFTACETMEDPKTEYASTYPISGEWFVKLETESAPGTWDDLTGYTKIMTYNTSGNSKDTIWIDDLGNTWSFKVKCPIVLDSKTFGMADSVVNSDTTYPIKVIVKSGFVSIGNAKTVSGVKSDSIYFLVGFEDDPGTVYRISGHRRTGFLEDEH